jgi:hypothetical protein
VKEVRGRTHSEFHLECECGTAIVSHNDGGQCAACGIRWEVRHPTVRETAEQLVEKARKQKAMKERYKVCR